MGGETRKSDTVYRVRDWLADYVRDPDEALGRLRKALVGALRRLAARAGWPGDPEDLAQEKFAEWLQASPPAFLRWNPGAPFIHYVKQIARNTLRAEARRRRRAVETGGHPDEPLEDVAAGLPLELAELREDLERLKEQLPPPWKQILGWLIARATNGEIAARLRAWGRIGAGRSKQLVRERIEIASDKLYGKEKLLRELLAREERKKKSRWEIDPPPLYKTIYTYGGAPCRPRRAAGEGAARMRRTGSTGPDPSQARGSGEISCTPRLQASWSRRRRPTNSPRRPAWLAGTRSSRR